MRNVKLLSKFLTFGLALSLLGSCAQLKIVTYIADPTPSVWGFVGSDHKGKPFFIAWPNSEGLVCYDEVDHQTLTTFCTRKCPKKGSPIGRGPSVKTYISNAATGLVGAAKTIPWRQAEGYVCHTPEDNRTMQNYCISRCSK